MSRLGGHVDPFLVLLAPLWVVWPSPLSLAFAQIAVVVARGASRLLARAAPSRLPSGGRRARARLPRVPVGRDERVASDPSGDVRDHVLPLLRLVPRHRAARARSRSSRLLAMSTGELMGLPIARARDLVRARAWTAARGRGHRARGARLDDRRRLRRRARTSRGDDSIFYGFYDQVGGSPQGVVRTLFTDPGAVLGALVEAHDVVYLVWLGLPLALPVRALAGARARRAAAAPRQRALRLPLDDRPAVPQRRRDRPVPHRGDRVRHRQDRRAARRPLAAGGVLVCSTSIALVARAVGTTRRRDAARRRASVTPAIGRQRSRMPSRSCPTMQRCTTSNTSGAHLSARQIHLLGARPRAGRRGSWSTAAIRGS